MEYASAKKTMRDNNCEIIDFISGCLTAALAHTTRSSRTHDFR